ncbi:hypothetical protein AXG93_2415s1230 [Marchantia polymorpha subsp. ruderalis]|uniref:Uncharacterized protein n=1 Tax=Marchantia polymorpha subsp. ruderalis TaxID=1480154 RepID=A0A176VUR6_MARPO|nr:hypothetical protein AXG93_2415s1230 [Marchantia polymorpha subsp. ruderalis]
MRDSTRSHGFMKTGSGKLASLRSIHPQYRVGAKSCDGGDDSHVRAMWDEEFFGHDLPPNYIISREGSVDEHHSKRKDSGSSRRDLTELSPREQAMWDEEFLGHELPSNYRISRDKTSEQDSSRRKESDNSSSRRGPKKSNSGEKSGCRGSSHRHARFMSEDTFEYHFDRTVDTYVLCDKKPASCKANGSSNLDTNGGGGGARDRSVRTKEESCTKEETFEERALRFGVEDWNLVGKKWSHSESKSSRRSSRRGIFHSPSGSDSSSLVSTLESSSFSCGSEGSSFAKGDYAASGYSQSNGFSMSSVRIPLSALARPSTDANGEGEKVTDDAQFVELTLLDRSKSDASDAKPKESGAAEQENGNFLEFNFLDGRMVESPDDEDVEAEEEGNGQSGRKFSIRLKDEDVSSEEFAERSAATPTVYQSATTQSPESESFFGSSHDSDWSGTHSISTERGGPTSARDVGDRGDVEDDASVYTEDRTEDWSSETQFFDANSASVPPKKVSSTSGGSKEHIQLGHRGELAAWARS